MRGGKEVCNGSPLRRYAPALLEGEPLAGRKAQKTPFRSGNSVRGFSFALASTMSTLISYAFIICHSPQKSSVAQKVYKRALSVTFGDTARVAAPRGAGYLAEFHFFGDSSFRIEHRRRCGVRLSCGVGTPQMTRTPQTLRSSTLRRYYIKYLEHRKMFYHSRAAVRG